MGKSPAAPAKSKPSDLTGSSPAPKAKPAPVVKKAAAKQAVLFPKPKLLMLKLGSVDVPVVKEGKGSWQTITQQHWNLEHQESLLAYWAMQKRENPKFNIDAKKEKLFVMPEAAEAEPTMEEEAAADAGSETEEEMDGFSDLDDDGPAK